MSGEARATTGMRMMQAAKARGLTRDQLRRRVDVVTTRQMDRYLDDPIKVPDYVVARASEVLDVTADYLLGLISEPLPLRGSNAGRSATPPAEANVERAAPGDPIDAYVDPPEEGEGAA